MEQPPDGLVRQEVVEAVDDLVTHLGPGAERRAVRRLQDALPIRPRHLHRRVAVVVIDLGEVRHHIRRLAAPGDHIVDAAPLVDMLPHQVHQEVHRLHPVERRPPLVRRPGRVRRNPAEAELGRQVRQRIPRTGVVPVAGMPGQHRVHIGEETLAHQVHLPGAALFGGRPVHPDPPFAPAAFQPVLRRQSRSHRGRPEEMVPAGVPGADPFALFRPGRRRLADAGQRVEFGEDPDHRTAGAPLRHERRRHPGDPGLHLEPGGAQLLLQEAGTALFLVADFGPFPDAERHLVEVGALRPEEVADHRMRVVVLGGGRRRGSEEQGRQAEGKGRGSEHGSLRSESGRGTGKTGFGV